jgi:hypothetical protein
MSNHNKETVFTGIDVHEKTYPVAYTVNSEIHRQNTIPACS